MIVGGYWLAQAPSGRNGSIAASISTGLLIAATATTLWGVWFFRGYGMIGLLATASILGGRAAATAERAAQEYPWRWWWVIPVFFGLVGGMRALAFWLGILAVLR